MSNKQIALALGISERTIEFHLKNIYDKLQVASRVEAILKLGITTGANSGKPVESTVEMDGKNVDNGNQPARMRATYSWRNTISLIKKEVAMTIHISFEDLENYLRSKPTLFGLLMLFTTSLTIYHVLFGLGLYFWISYLLLGLLLGAGSIRVGRIMKNRQQVSPLRLIAIAALIPLLAAGFDQLYVNTVLRFTDPISIAITNISARAEWLTAPNGSLYRSTHLSTTSNDLWFLSIAYMLIVFFISNTIGNRSDKNNPAAA